jgi:hypothetical protein
MTDERLRDLYLAGLDARRAREPRRGCDVEPEVLLALARGELPPEDRPELLDRVLSSAACREELALLRAVVVAERGEVPTAAADEEVADAGPADPAVVPLHGVRAPRPPRPPRAWPWARLGVPLAAAAALALAVGVPALLREDPAPVMRGEGAPVVLVAPAAEAAPAEARTFTWRAVPGARRYVFELLDADGAPLHEDVGEDTTLVLPAAVTLEPGAEYRWLVRAADALGDPIATSVGRVRIR